MAKGSVRKKGKKWYARFYIEDESGRKVQKEFVGIESKSETEALLRKAIADYEEKKFVAKSENITVGMLLDLWVEEELKPGNLSNGTVMSYQGTVNRIKQHPIGNRKLKTVTADHLQAYIDFLSFGGTNPDGTTAKALSKGYLRLFSAVLQGAFRFAVFPKRLITFNPMQYVVWRGKKGFNSVLALIFTFAVVVMMYIPMMYIGVSPFIAATLSVVIITLITFILLADFQKKSIGAMLGTIAGVVVSGLIALVFGHFGHVTGYNVDDIENLIYVGQNSKLDIGGMLFSGILIASLGAVMDVAMSVSSSLHEIKENRPDISAKEIFHAGINIGRDMIGTMSNTLILAYAGGSLGLVMIIYAYSYQMHQILNMYSVAIEIMRGISGTMGIILTVPITSLIMSVLLTQKGKK